jgi:two-component system, sensor histidine kinase and response regulator
MKKILVIEDEPLVRENLEDILEIENFQVVSAANGKIGLELAKKEIPDLIICDIMMPELDGYEVLNYLRSDETIAKIPFIFLTAKAERLDLRQGMELGADDYLVKPFTPQELLKAIEARLKKEDIIQQISEQKLEQLRNSISYALPHELRTPLNGIVIASDFLLSQLGMGTLDEETIREMVLSIRESSDRLSHLIRNFWLYADLQLKLNNPHQLKSLHHEYIANARLLIESILIACAEKKERYQDLKIAITDACLKISGEALNKLLSELLDNAFKFSKPGTPVTVTSKINRDQFILTIEDQGRGMSPEHIQQIGAYMQFERQFYEQQGAGLGLKIAQLLTTIYQGSLEIKSVLNQGTIVTITLQVHQL